MKVHTKSIIQRALRYVCEPIERLFKRTGHHLLTQFSNHIIHCVTFFLFVLLYHIWFIRVWVFFSGYLFVRMVNEKGSR
jgi:IS4 transposase